LSFTLQGVAKEKSLKTIMVTSSEPNEGKSTVAASLAYTLAETGYKTLLVDADQYRPAVHRYFSSPNKEGLSDLLHSDVTEKKAVSKTDVPGLSIITSGSMPENLDELLLAGEKIKKVLEQFSRQYDYVILDSPAFLGIVDSLILSPLVDGVLLVTRLGTTRSVSLKTTCQQLESVQAKIIGVVLNCVEDVYSTRYYRDRAVRKRTHILERLNREPIVELEKFSKEEGRAQLPTEAVSETL
jgi:capsular exopolysaccharide synthesis family protein